MKRKSWTAMMAAAMVAVQCSSAGAAVLWAGGEDIDFTAIGTVAVNLTSNTFRANYARESVQVSGTTAADPPPSRIYTQAFAANSTLWFHAVDGSLLASSLSNNQDICALSPDAVCRLLLRGTGTNGTVKVSKRTAAGSFTDLVTCAVGGYPIQSILAKIDWNINYAVSGGFTLYSNGVQICSFSGDVTTDGATQLNQFFLATPSGSATNWSEVVVSTTDTRNIGLFTCYPTANGTNMSWTGSFANVNPTTINDASSISTGGNNLVAEFNCPSLPSGTFTVPAVASSARMQIGATGPQNFQFVTRPGTGSTDYFSGTIAGATTFTNSYQLQALNPATSSAWTQADVTGLQQGVKSVP